MTKTNSNILLFAFLRAINVGGHTVRMEKLRSVCEQIGLANAATFIASGNVIFEAAVDDLPMLEKTIDEAVLREFGFSSPTFIRTGEELKQIAATQPFPETLYRSAEAFNIAFLSHKPESALIDKLMKKENDIDHFQVVGREVYWLCAKKQSESSFSNAVLEKTISQYSTIRGRATIQNMIDKFLTD